VSASRYLIGDVFDVMATLPDASVDMVMTSPPFLALRSYLPADHPDKGKEIGSEPSPAEFIDTLLALTAEWERLLAPHGSICVELGDTYSGSGGGPDANHIGSLRPVNATKGTGWPLAKSLCGIPWLYSLSLAYGRNLLTGEPSPAGMWRVRNVVAWCRPNPPVGALGDKFRPATSYLTIATKDPKRYFDLDAVRHANPRVDEAGLTGEKNKASGVRGSTNAPQNPAGAPPLDYWEIPTAPYVTPDGLVVPAGGTAHQIRVPLDAGADGILRTTSPDCPVHGSPDRRGSNAPDGGHAGDDLSRTEHIDARLDPAPHGVTPPTLWSPDPTASTTETLDPACGDSASLNGNGSNRTDLAQSTSPAGTPSDQTTAGTGGTSGSPEFVEPSLDTTGSRTSADGSTDSPLLRTAGGSADTRTEPAFSSACTCSYSAKIVVKAEDTTHYADNPPDYWDIPTVGYRGSHYAVFPPALLERPIKSMCPMQVCTVCGEPRRRIVEVAGEVSVGGPRERDRQGRGRSAERLGLGATGSQHTATRTVDTVGWTDCGHDSWRNGIVLDPFGGSGTTAQVATGLGRDCILIDLDERNAELARERVGMFLTVEEQPP
jgi:site-specific DNA-methyltransferase (cytosine-N4-specific)